ncbi:sugar transport protein [Enterococcus sp. BWB1-3]|uniref:GRP family sugar transporter n=1 Tax=Enterococcus sp. BWB1-3 TaxID=2787713 RepID=UPI001924FDCF|nr:GRP family sugar transporter [Enterococcus sp. BWB1-3]MBL1230002.1 sugar transport protein [Enterococcus sp. BWB1-3]
MTIFLAVLPALGWGLMPVIAQLSKGKPNEQLLGTSTTALLFGIGFFLWIKPEWTELVFITGFLSGAFWSGGQYLQFHSFIDLPVSEAMPISNGTQLIGTTIAAAVFFNEWSNAAMTAVGLLSIGIIITGIYLTNYHEKKGEEQAGLKKKPLLKLLLSSLTLTVYVILPRFFDISGEAIIFPQSIGMFTASYLMNLSQIKIMNRVYILRNMTTGLAWSIANVSLFLVIPSLGVGKSFTISQLAVLVSLFAGLIVFKPDKSKKERRAIILGASCITMGILMISLLKNG